MCIASVFWMRCTSGLANARVLLSQTATHLGDAVQF